MLLEEGKLLGLTYDAEQNITGWHEHATGGAVESIKVIPDIDGGRDELWMVVRRTINGATVRYLEYMLQEYDSAFITQEWARVLDCMATYNGVATTVISGLGFLEGQTVAVVTDGATHASRTVSGGSITLDWPSSVVHVGINNAAEIITLPLEGGLNALPKHDCDLSIRLAVNSAMRAANIWISFAREITQTIWMRRLRCLMAWLPFRGLASLMRMEASVSCRTCRSQ